MAKVKVEETYLVDIINYLSGYETEEKLKQFFSDVVLYQYDYTNQRNTNSILANYTQYDPMTVLNEIASIKSKIDEYKARVEQITDEALPIMKEVVQEQIKKKYMPHIQSLIEMSNQLNISEENQENYEAACMIKTFVVELSEKMLLALSNEKYLKDKIKEIILQKEQQTIKNQNLPIEPIAKRICCENITDKEEKSQKQFEIVNILIGKIKDSEQVMMATQSRKRTGHEIEDMYAALPSNIASLIKYKTLTSLVIEDITQKGEIPKENKFYNAADYFIMIKEFNPQDMEKIGKNSKTINQGIHKNNLGFIDYRYLQKKAGLTDYEILNAVSISLYQILDFATKSSTIVKENISIDYDSLKDIFTKEEYDKIIDYSNKNKEADKQSIISYYAFMKTYIDSHKIDMNDNKYKNINNFFKMIKDTNNIAELGQIFCQWYSQLDLTLLSPEELTELQMIDPTYIYNSLSYTDKLIYQKCKESGIEYSFYYKYNIETFEFIINNYSNYFKGKRIGENCIILPQSQLSKIATQLNQKGQNIGEVPDYYFKYHSDFLKTLSKNSNETIIPEEEFKKMYSRYQQYYDSVMFSGLPKLESTSQSLKLEEKIKKYVIATGGKADEVLNLLKEPTGNYLLDQELKGKIRIILKIISMTKITDITQLLKMPVEYLYNQYRHLLLKEKTQVVQQEQSLSNKPYTITNDISEFIENVTVLPNMKFLTKNEVCSNYTYCNNYAKSISDDPNDFQPLPISEYLLYRTPEETTKIIEICKKYNMDFEPELLFFDPTELSKLGDFETNLVLYSIKLVKETKLKEGTKFTYENSRIILEQIQNSPIFLTKRPTNNKQNEIDDMFVITTQKTEDKQKQKHQ